MTTSGLQPNPEPRKDRVEVQWGGGGPSSCCWLSWSPQASGQHRSTPGARPMGTGPPRQTLLSGCHSARPSPDSPDFIRTADLAFLFRSCLQRRSPGSDITLIRKTVPRRRPIPAGHVPARHCSSSQSPHPSLRHSLLCPIAVFPWRSHPWPHCSLPGPNVPPRHA